jgi:short-subunit dehydrogenase
MSITDDRPDETRLSAVQGRLAVVTGATGGLGQAIARRLADEGARLVVTGRQRVVLERLADELGATAVVCDLAVRADLPALLDIVADADVLVSNAALPATGPLDDFTVGEIDRALDVNLRAPILLARAAGAGMVRRHTGHIVFVSSLSAKMIAPALGVYGATKAGLRALSLSLREDLRPAGVGVSVIFPGAIGEAGMWADAGIPTPRTVRLRSRKDVARAVIDAIEHDRAEIEVANPAVRLGALLAQVRPAWFAAFARRAGAAEIAKQMTEAGRTKR